MTPLFMLDNLIYRERLAFCRGLYGMPQRDDKTGKRFNETEHNEGSALRQHLIEVWPADFPMSLEQVLRFTAPYNTVLGSDFNDGFIGRLRPDENKSVKLGREARTIMDGIFSRDYNGIY